MSIGSLDTDMTDRKAQMPGKFFNKKTTIDSYTFDSLKEGQRYVELSAMVVRGEIKDLVVHPKYEIKVASRRICSYSADFLYTIVETGEVICEDVKSVATKTPVYRLKRKLMAAVHGIDILETGIEKKKTRRRRAKPKA
jgi:hypothetical protein